MNQIDKFVIERLDPQADAVRAECFIRRLLNGIKYEAADQRKYHCGHTTRKKAFHIGSPIYPDTKIALARWIASSAVCGLRYSAGLVIASRGVSPELRAASS